MSERWNVKDLERFWSRVIRSSVESRRVLARRFGVSLSLISAVRNRRVWL